MDYLLVDGDQTIFHPIFEAAQVVVRTGALTASGPARLGGKKLCVVGDEKSVKVPGCLYSTMSHPMPGTGTLEVAALAGDQRSGTLTIRDAKVLLVGSRFTAKFTVDSPAQQPAPSGPPVPDTKSQYSGTGRFITTNTKFRGS